jgi:hypothetical protein
MLRFFDVRVKIPKLLLGGQHFQIRIVSLLIYQRMTDRGAQTLPLVAFPASAGYPHVMH